jgi:hypothetical protein
MARQFLDTDTSPWEVRFGDGSDGAYEPSTSTDSPLDAGCTGTSGSTSLSATNTSFSPGQVILIHQSRSSTRGNWELNKIQSYSAGTITTVYPLQNTYSSLSQVMVLRQYSSANIASGVTVVAKSWNGTTGGIYGFVCLGETTISGTISANGSGLRGGAGSSHSSTAAAEPFKGEGETAASVQKTSDSDTGANGITGGGADRGGDGGSGGGGGGHATNGTAGGDNQGNPGQGAGTSADVANLTNITFGGGGGGARGESNRDNGGNGGSGGASGGFVLIISKNVTVTGSLSANGSNGGNASGADPQEGASGGGGGSGGAILLKGQTIALGTSLVSATGGTGGSGNGGGGKQGGNGGSGRIHADYSQLISGTTSPSIDTSINAILNDLPRDDIYSFLM